MQPPRQVVRLRCLHTKFFSLRNRIKYKYVQTKKEEEENKQVAAMEIYAHNTDKHSTQQIMLECKNIQCAEACTTFRYV